MKLNQASALSFLFVLISGVSMVNSKEYLFANPRQVMAKNKDRFEVPQKSKLPPSVTMVAFKPDAETAALAKDVSKKLIAQMLDSSSVDQIFASDECFNILPRHICKGSRTSGFYMWTKELGRRGIIKHLEEDMAKKLQWNLIMWKLTGKRANLFDVLAETAKSVIGDKHDHSRH